MGNFCVKCGKPLAEGQPCDCEGGAPAGQAPVQNQNTAQVSTEKSRAGEVMGEARGEAKGILGNILNIYKNPDEVTKKENSLMTSIVAFVMQTVAIFLVIVFALNRLFSEIVKTMFGGRSSDVAKDAIAEAKERIFGDAMYIKLFVIVALSCATFYVIYTLLTFLIFGVWKKEKIDFKSALIKFSYLMIPLTITIILAFAGSYIHTYLVVGIFWYGIIHYSLFAYKYFKNNFNSNGNFLMLITPLIIVVTTLVGLWATGKITEVFIEDVLNQLTQSVNPFSSLF